MIYSQQNKYNSTLLNRKLVITSTHDNYIIDSITKRSRMLGLEAPKQKPNADFKQGKGGLVVGTEYSYCLTNYDSKTGTESPAGIPTSFAGTESDTDFKVFKYEDLGGEHYVYIMSWQLVAIPDYYVNRAMSVLVTNDDYKNIYSEWQYRIITNYEFDSQTGIGKFRLNRGLTHVDSSLVETYECRLGLIEVIEGEVGADAKNNRKVALDRIYEMDLTAKVIFITNGKGKGEKRFIIAQERAMFGVQELTVVTVGKAFKTRPRFFDKGTEEEEFAFREKKEGKKGKVRSKNFYKKYYSSEFVIIDPLENNGLVRRGEVINYNRNKLAINLSGLNFDEIVISQGRIIAYDTTTQGNRVKLRLDYEVDTVNDYETGEAGELVSYVLKTLSGNLKDKEFNITKSWCFETKNSTKTHVGQWVELDVTTTNATKKDMFNLNYMIVQIPPSKFNIIQQGRILKTKREKKTNVWNKSTLNVDMSFPLPHVSNIYPTIISPFSIKLAGNRTTIGSVIPPNENGDYVGFLRIPYLITIASINSKQSLETDFLINVDDAIYEIISWVDQSDGIILNFRNNGIPIRGTQDTTSFKWIRDNVISASGEGLLPVALYYSETPNITPDIKQDGLYTGWKIVFTKDNYVPSKNKEAYITGYDETSNTCFLDKPVLDIGPGWNYTMFSEYTKQFGSQVIRGSSTETTTNNPIYFFITQNASSIDSFYNGWKFDIYQSDKKNKKYKNSFFVHQYIARDKQIFNGTADASREAVMSRVTQLGDYVSFYDPNSYIYSIIEDDYTVNGSFTDIDSLATNSEMFCELTGLPKTGNGNDKLRIYRANSNTGDYRFLDEVNVGIQFYRDDSDDTALGQILDFDLYNFEGGKYCCNVKNMLYVGGGDMFGESIYPVYGLPFAFTDSTNVRENSNTTVNNKEFTIDKVMPNYGLAIGGKKNDKFYKGNRYIMLNASVEDLSSKYMRIVCVMEVPTDITTGQLSERIIFGRISKNGLRKAIIKHSENNIDDIINENLVVINNGIRDESQAKVGNRYFLRDNLYVYDFEINSRDFSNDDELRFGAISIETTFLFNLYYLRVNFFSKEIKPAIECLANNVTFSDYIDELSVFDSFKDQQIGILVNLLDEELNQRIMLENISFISNDGFPVKIQILADSLINFDNVRYKMQSAYISMSTGQKIYFIYNNTEIIVPIIVDEIDNTIFEFDYTGVTIGMDFFDWIEDVSGEMVAQNRDIYILGDALENIDIKLSLFHKSILPYNFMFKTSEKIQGLTDNKYYLDSNSLPYKINFSYKQNLIQRSAYPETNELTSLAGAISLEEGDSDFITGLIEYNGYLVAFKQNSIWMYDNDNNNQPKLYKIDNVSGCIAPDTIARSEKGIYFMASAGKLYRFSYDFYRNTKSANTFVNEKIHPGFSGNVHQNTTADISGQKDIDMTKIKESIGFFIPQNQTYYLNIPQKGGGWLLFAYYEDGDDWYRINFPENIGNRINEVIFFEGIVLFATDKGVFEYDTSQDYNQNKKIMAWELQSNWQNYSNTMEKMLKRRMVMVNYKPKNALSPNVKTEAIVRYYKDFDDDYAEPNTMLYNSTDRHISTVEPLTRCHIGVRGITYKFRIIGTAETYANIRDIGVEMRRKGDENAWNNISDVDV